MSVFASLLKRLRLTGRSETRSERSGLLADRRSARVEHFDLEWVYCDSCWWQASAPYFDLLDDLNPNCTCGTPLQILHDLKHYEVKELEGGASMAFIVARRRMLASSKPAA